MKDLKDRYIKNLKNNYLVSVFADTIFVTQLDNHECYIEWDPQFLHMRFRDFNIRSLKRFYSRKDIYLYFTELDPDFFNDSKLSQFDFKDFKEYAEFKRFDFFE